MAVTMVTGCKVVVAWRHKDLVAMYHHGNQFSFSLLRHRSRSLLMKDSLILLLVVLYAKNENEKKMI